MCMYVYYVLVSSKQIIDKSQGLFCGIFPAIGSRFDDRRDFNGVFQHFAL
jgi:hypothetical protein